MKNTKLSLLDYLKKIQYFIDEGFTLEEMSCDKSLTIGMYIKETDEHLYFGLNDLKDFAKKYGMIDISLYRGEVKRIAACLNKIIEVFDYDSKK